MLTGVGSKKEYPLMSEGLYFAKIEKVIPDKINKFKVEPEDSDTVVEYILNIIEDEGGNKKSAGRKFWLSYHPKSKRNIELYNAAMGTDIVPGEEGANLNEQDVVDKVIRVLIKHKKNNRGDMKDYIDSYTKVPKGYLPEEIDIDQVIPDEAEVI